MDLSAHTSLTPLAEAVAAVLEAASAAGLEIYIAGALARDLWLEFAYDINTGRRTTDVDFAVECADWNAFEHLRAALLSGGDLVQGDEPRHKFHPVRRRRARRSHAGLVSTADLSACRAKDCGRGA